jgi:beta-glucanase (GH16 family)
MKNKYSYAILGSVFFGLLLMMSCGDRAVLENYSSETIESSFDEIKVEAEDYILSSNLIETKEIDSNFAYIQTKSDGWVALDVNILKAGKYNIQIHLSSLSNSVIKCWIEDYYDNNNDRTYNITGNILTDNLSTEYSTISKLGTPLNSGLHKMKLHFDKEVNVDWIKFTLIEESLSSPITMRQNIDGSDWKLVWSDEFTNNFIDTTKWTYDVGNWGWGNNEIQYYTKHRPKNARVVDGNLIIEAHKNDLGEEWTSARLTTRGKVSFLYGKIECRAKVPSGKGSHASAWTLGNEYVDESSLPYCGEIAILESVGYEIDDDTGNGITHASADGGAFYFGGDKKNGFIEVANMSNEFHTYVVEWKPDGIKEYVDNKLYAAYDNTSTDLSWPFSKSQNIVLNLAMGGSRGGSQGIDESISSQKMIIDYIRVYELN